MHCSSTSGRNTPRFFKHSFGLLLALVNFEVRLNLKIPHGKIFGFVCHGVAPKVMSLVRGTMSVGSRQVSTAVPMNRHWQPQARNSPAGGIAAHG